MIFKPYYQKPEIYSETAQTAEAELNHLGEAAASGNTLLNALGSFWYITFAEQAEFLHVATGAVTSYLGESYRTLLSQVLASTIIDIPVTNRRMPELYAFDKQDADFVFDNGELSYISFELPDLLDVDYIHNQLSCSEVILDKANYFEVVDGELRFFVNIFEDEIILKNSYVYGTGNQVILLWLSGVCLQETSIFDRFGRFVFEKQANSDYYKNTVTALQFFFTKAKSADNLETILNILFGLPFSKSPNEIVLRIEVEDASGQITEHENSYNVNSEADTPQELAEAGWAYKVTTTENVYYAPLYSELAVSVGQVLDRFQLVAKVHQVHDYIKTPDWYKDARFPFELVSSYDSYNTLNTPDEFHAYLPQMCDGSALYDGEFKHTGEYATYEGIDPFALTRSKSEAEGGTDFEQSLYSLVDQVLKYNLVYLKTDLNFENIDYYLDNNIRESLQVVEKGVPSYIYPVIEASFTSDFVDSSTDVGEETESSASMGNQNDQYSLCPNRLCDGTLLCSGDVQFTYDGSYDHAGDTRCYPYGGQYAALYDCAREEGRRKAQLAAFFETYDVLDLDGSNTFSQAASPVLYNGFRAYDGSVSFSQEILDVESLSMRTDMPLYSDFQLADGLEITVLRRS